MAQLFFQYEIQLVTLGFHQVISHGKILRNNVITHGQNCFYDHQGFYDSMIFMLFIPTLGHHKFDSNVF